MVTIPRESATADPSSSSSAKGVDTPPFDMHSFDTPPFDASPFDPSPRRSGSLEPPPPPNVTAATDVNEDNTTCISSLENGSNPATMASNSSPLSVISMMSAEGRRDRSLSAEGTLRRVIGNTPSAGAARPVSSYRQRRAFAARTDATLLNRPKVREQP